MNNQLVLEKAVALADEIITVASPVTPEWAWLRVLAYGFVVRTRRIARAVGALSPSYDYEARVLVRALLETHFNYEWIHLQDAEIRAERFWQYQVLDKLKMMTNYPPAMRSGTFEDKRRELENERQELAPLFQRTDRAGRLRWATSWADVPSVESRISQVQKAALPDDSQADKFMYMLYQWFSGVAHGSPQAVAELLRVSNEWTIAKSDTELHGERSLISSNIAFLIVLRRAARDLGVGDERTTRADALYSEYRSYIMAQ